MELKKQQIYDAVASQEEIHLAGLQVKKVSAYHVHQQRGHWCRLLNQRV
jgi:hypothetical protein